MICVVIKGPTYDEAERQIAEALVYADLIELRLDFFDLLDLEVLKILRSHFSVPMIFTLRSRGHGGNYSGSEKSRLENIGKLAHLNPEYLDLEIDVPLDFIKGISQQNPNVKLIYSYHNFLETPQDLESIYLDMRKVPACYFKIAAMAHNSLDALRLISWSKGHKDQLIAISMGSHGQISRIAAPITGSPFTYASLEAEPDPITGQLPAKMLLERYYYRSLNRETSLFGLIGDPIIQSISDQTHNFVFHRSRINALYLKMQVTPTELKDFVSFAKKLAFAGLSVTMPLKEHIMPFLDAIAFEAADIGAVNTLVFGKNRLSGYNTDGVGALNAIERLSVVKDKRMVIIGAGGAAKAIAYEAQRRGALIKILNRDAQKAVELAERLECYGNGLKEMRHCATSGYEILINCTPSQMPISPDDILSNTIVMDIKTKPQVSEFLESAKKKNCSLVYGYQMFIEQALGQFDLWFKSRIERQMLEEKTLEIKQGALMSSLSDC